VTRTLTLDEAAAVLKTTPETVSDAITRLGLSVSGVVLATAEIPRRLRSGELERALAPGATIKPAKPRLPTVDDIRRLLANDAKRREQRAAINLHHTAKRRAAKIEISTDRHASSRR
jgi:type II secretory pathway component PulC